MANLPSPHSGGVGFSTRSSGSYRGSSPSPGSTGSRSLGFSPFEPSPKLGKLILLGMFRSRSSKGNEGESPSRRAWLNPGSSGGIGSNVVWGTGVWGLMISGGASIWVCWLVEPGRPPRIFNVSSSGVDEEAGLFAPSSGTSGEIDEESARISNELVGLNIEILVSSSGLKFCG